MVFVSSSRKHVMAVVTHLKILYLWVMQTLGLLLWMTFIGILELRATECVDKPFLSSFYMSDRGMVCFQKSIPFCHSGTCCTSTALPSSAHVFLGLSVLADYHSRILWKNTNSLKTKNKETFFVVDLSKPNVFVSRKITRFPFQQQSQPIFYAHCSSCTGSQCFIVHFFQFYLFLELPEI